MMWLRAGQGGRQSEGQEERRGAMGRLQSRPLLVTARPHLRRRSFLSRDLDRLRSLLRERLRLRRFGLGAASDFLGSAAAAALDAGFSDLGGSSFTSWAWRAAAWFSSSAMTGRKATGAPNPP